MGIVLILLAVIVTILFDRMNVKFLSHEIPHPSSREAPLKSMIKSVYGADMIARVPKRVVIGTVVGAAVSAGEEFRF